MFSASICLLAVLSQTPTTKPAEKPAEKKELRLEGCPVAGVEGNCMMLVTKKGEKYNLSAATEKPDPLRNLQIIVDANRNPGGMSICMEGIQLKDIAWRYSKRKCPAKKPAAQ